VHTRCNLGARYRWGIEGAFLVEKHQGYSYEHAQLDGRAMGWSYESSGSQTDRALLHEAESLTHRYAESGLRSVDRSHERHLGDDVAFRSGSAGDLRTQKRDHYAQLLREQAMLPRPYPQIAADEIGGFLTKFSQSGALARAGLRGIVEKYGKTLEETERDWK